MLWEHLYDAITLCSKHRILTDITTNGTLLNEETISKLGSAGLNCLNVSVDTRDNFSISNKNVLFDENIMQLLKSAEMKYGMKLRMNSVISNNNFDDIKLLLELSNESKTPLSLGFVVPDMNIVDNKDIYFSEKDHELLGKLISYILAKKKDGYPIIDPDSYFENVYRFIRNESFWKCNYPTKYGWINVIANGAIRSCTKKMDDTGIEFLSLTSKSIKSYKRSLENPIEKCNPYCYSNCAYDSAYYKKNKIAFVLDNFSKTF
ncbi:MAG: hypothetical protein FWG88_03545 [Oscillospiraceae bacterium]|nr:hypothetical protein [Oscillospiraceae bacterium]